MISNDNDWKNLVRNIANDSIGLGPNRRMLELEAAGYLWDSSNWERLKETSHGKFLRECGSVNDCPDYGLRRMYRDEVLKNGQAS